MKQVKELEAQPGSILAAAFSADGKLVLVGGASDEVRVYEADKGTRKQVLKAPGGWIYAAAFRPDGERIAVAGYDGLVRIFELKEGKEVRAFPAAPIGRVRRF
jgi:WD40 repeat protein